LLSLEGRQQLKEKRSNKMKKTLVVLMTLAGVGTAMAYTQDDIVRWNPSNGWWDLQHAESTSPQLDGTSDSWVNWGAAGDVPLVGDVNGDGIDDVAVVRPGSEGNWYAAHSVDAGGGYGALSGTSWSQASSLGWYNASPNYFLEKVNADAYADAVVAENWSGQWRWRGAHSSAAGLGGTPGDSDQWFGWVSTDVPLMGDFNGDGLSDMALYSNGTTWYTGLSTASGLNQTTIGTGYFGAAGDIPLVGDINGDGRDDALVLRPAGSGDLNWFVGYSDANGVIAGDGWADLGWWGTTNTSSSVDTPILADIDGDGKDDLGIFRDYGVGTDGWFWDLSSDGYGEVYSQGADLTNWWGAPGDIPLIGQFDVIPEPATLAMLLLAAESCGFASGS
jgi:hypothetical protein